MPERNEDIETSKKGSEFSHIIGASATRKLKARGSSKSGVWFGLGMAGLIGWSVVVPTLGGAAAGIWLDSRRHGTHLGAEPGVHSWTLTLLILGLALGCINAWHWVEKEDREMQDGQNG